MDYKELADRLGLEEDEYVEILELFIETGEADLAKLNAALKTNDLEQAAKISHSLKGASGSLGLLEISDHARSIENNSRNGTLDGAGESAASIRKQMDELIAGLRNR